MEEKHLLELGLTRNEIKIYLALLKIGSSLAGEITEKTGIHRRNVYDCVERLLEKGLVSYVIIDNKKWFNAVNPNRFLEILDEKKHEIDEKKKSIEKVMPSLNLMRSMTKKQDVRFFKGAEGLKTVYEDILRTKKDYVGYGPGKVVEKILKLYFRFYIKRRKAIRIKTRLIYSEKERGTDFTRTALADIKFLPDKYCSHSALRIYGDKVALLLLSEDEPLAILIKNKNIADGYRKYFEVIWDAAKY